MVGIEREPGEEVMDGGCIVSLDLYKILPEVFRLETERGQGDVSNRVKAHLDITFIWCLVEKPLKELNTWLQDSTV